MEEEKAMWDAYSVSQKEGGKSYWSRIGVAFLNRDHSINVLLEAIPIDGKVQLRTRQENGNGKNKKKENQYEIQD